jgi:hypothetical protein
MNKLDNVLCIHGWWLVGGWLVIGTSSKLLIARDYQRLLAVKSPNHGLNFGSTSPESLKEKSYLSMIIGWSSPANNRLYSNKQSFVSILCCPPVGFTL